MDRDKRWERVKIAVDGLTGKIDRTGDVLTASDGGDAGSKIEENYKKDITDEFLKPILIGGDETRIKGILAHTGESPWLTLQGGPR